ncbi:MAG: hypothetical protein OEY97_11750 [Nitrospirota bacterium]|nr:hypothetical protein [Nitrospirota bacterium]
MKRVYGIGISKTGTTTVESAIQILGFVGYSNEDTAARFEEYDRDWPGSKFIYTVRETESWLRSVVNHWEWEKRIKREVHHIQVAALHSLFGGGLFEFDRESYIKAYYRHEQRILSYFKNRPSDLLVIDVCAGEGWEKICPFLGVPIPDKPFPASNVGVSPARLDSPTVAAAPDATQGMQTN